MKNFLFIITAFLLGFNTYSQIGIGDASGLKALKNSRIYVVNDTNTMYVDDYNNRIKCFIDAVINYWTFCPKEIINTKQYSKLDKTIKKESFFLNYTEIWTGEWKYNLWITFSKGALGNPEENIACFSASLGNPDYPITKKLQAQLLNDIDLYVRILNFYISLAEENNTYELTDTINKFAKALKDKTLFLRDNFSKVKLPVDSFPRVYKFPFQFIPVDKLTSIYKATEDQYYYLFLLCAKKKFESVANLRTGELVYISKPILDMQVTKYRKESFLELNRFVAQ
jgi:hypothetical protein